MSLGAKKVFIKLVAQAIPTYVMGAFKLSANLCEEMELMIRYFWWGDEKGQRKVHWMAWEKLLQAKCHGGIGFRDMQLFNQALLVRQAWRLIRYPDNLCVRVLKPRYYPNGVLVDTVFPAEASPTWRAIEHGLELVKKGIIWRIRSGTKVNIWRDPWLLRQSSFKISLQKGRSRLRWVSQLMKPDTREWDEQILQLCLYRHDVDEVMKIRPMQYGYEDFVAWYYEKSRIFTVKSAYKLAIRAKQMNEGQSRSSSGSTEGRPIYKGIWSADVPPKVRIFG
jgi:hypothetical protein